MITNSPDETKNAAVKFATENIAPGDVIALVGSLGAGKTCFAKGIIEHITGVNDNFQGSPTFALVQEYDTKRETETSILKVYHFDFYRVKNEMELLHIGWQEYIADKNGVCVIEWADLYPQLLPPEAKWIKINAEDENKRVITTFQNK